jgi:hypothetical protein
MQSVLLVRLYALTMVDHGLQPFYYELLLRNMAAYGHE